MSVIVATYNQASSLGACLSSLLNQTLERSRYEILVVDDGSTDDTSAVLDSFAGEVRRFRFPGNRGLAHACNQGLTAASGTYVVRLDSDDRADRYLLRVELDLMASEPRIGMVMCDYWRVSPSDQERVTVAPDNVFSWVAVGVMARREAVIAAGGYRPVFWEEYDLYLRLLRDGWMVAYAPRPLVYVHMHEGSMTADEERRRQGWRELAELWGADVLARFGTHPELDAVLRSMEGKSAAARGSP